jgi:acetamidase/formamidase
MNMINFSNIRRAALILATASAALLSGHRSTEAQARRQYYVPSNSKTIIRGYFPTSRAPDVTVPNGAIVRIDTVSHQGLGGDGKDPVSFLAGFGVSANEVLSDATDIYYNYTAPPGASGHVLTGPVWVEGAAPGDTLEVRILKVEPRVGWGFNTQGTGGALPNYLSASFRKLIRIKNGFAHFSDDIEVPLNPFQGIMAVAPADDFVSPLPDAAAAHIVSARPPGPFGGNLDTKELGAGSILYLPVFQPGGQFYTGDPHAVQGNGEVSGTALELSNTVTVQFFVHKNGGLTGPRAETPTHYISMGIDVDHDEALRKSLHGALDFLTDEKSLLPQDAYSLCSLAVDFNIAESVDFTNVVMGLIPKWVFKDDCKEFPCLRHRFWRAPLIKSLPLDPIRHGRDEDD